METGGKQKLGMTRQRRLILETLREVKTHPSADRVYEMVREKLPRISLGTVYRNLEWLCREGLVHRLEEPTPKHYDGDMGNHVHFRCTGCGGVFDLPAGLLRRIGEVKGWVGEFDIRGQRVEFFGLCPGCRGKE